MAAKPNKKSGPKRNAFRRMFNAFENNLELHEVSIQIMGSHALRYDTNVWKKLVKSLSKRNRLRNKLHFSESDLDLINDTVKKHPKQAELFAKNTLVSVVSALDTLFAKLFEYYYTKYPEKLSIENRQITFNELKDIKNIEDAQKFLINREVETFLFQSNFKDKLKNLHDEFQISILENSQYVKDLKKLLKFRNLIVHNESRADEEYINLCDDSDLKKGEYLKVSPKYLKDSLALVYFIGGYTLQVAQIKFSVDPIKSEDFILNDVAHKLVGSGHFSFLRPIYDIALNEGVNEEVRKMIIINYCISLKKQGKTKDHIEKVLDQEDWTAVSDHFQMALEALRGNNRQFFALLKKLIGDKIVEKQELQEWEIFSFYKRNREFRSLQKKILK